MGPKAILNAVTKRKFRRPKPRIKSKMPDTKTATPPPDYDEIMEII
jgi:hypothetical protein